jgi:hypothetical protein
MQGGMETAVAYSDTSLIIIGRPLLQSQLIILLPQNVASLF